jgi:hypothetical protein
MKTRTKLIFLSTVLALGVAGYAFTASSEEAGPGFGPPFMHGGMGGMMGPRMGPAMMGMGPDSGTMKQLGIIHELIANHDRIRRTVTNLPDGIRTETTSDDPKVAEWIKTHVSEMGERVGTGDDPQLPIESDALHKIFRNKDKIRTSMETTANGIVVVQTSTDSETVAALQEHAAQVSEFVKGGMAAVHTAMMQNVGSAMHGRMMGGRPMGPGMMFGGGGIHR